MDGMNRSLLYDEPITKEQEIINVIIDTVAEVFETTAETIKSENRNRWLSVYPRYVAGYLIQQSLDITLTEAGNILNRDHSSIVHLNKQVPVLLHHKFGCKDFQDKWDNVNNLLWNIYGIKIDCTIFE